MRWLMHRGLRAIKLLVRKIYILIGKADEKLGGGYNKNAHEFFVHRTAGKYDMHEEAGESYYAKQYSDFIREELNKSGLGKGGTLIDLACGQGRIISELLSDSEIKFDKIIGVDFNANALKAAVLHLKLEDHDKKYIQLIHADINEFLYQVEDESIDVILLLEVLYMVPEYEEILGIIRQKLSLKGRAFISIRSDYFYSLITLRLGLMDEAVRTIKNNRGNILGTDIEFNWTNTATIAKEYPKKYGLNINNIKGIGACSGIETDPNDNICRPSDMSRKELQLLMQVEDYYGQTSPDTGRYILFSASSKK